MKRLVLDSKAIVNNLAAIRKRAGNAVIFAVLVGDAYGAGLVELGTLLRDQGITRFAISQPEDAAALRKAGFIEEELLMLRSTVNREELEQLMDLNVICSIGSAEAGMVLNSLAENRSTVAEAHVQVDCGMGYGGFLISEPEKVVTVYQNLQNVAISGIYTQFQSRATKEKEITAHLEAFSGLVDHLRKAGCETGLVHAAGSTSTMRFQFSHLDGVRVGSALLGRCQREKGDGLQRVGFCEAAVEEIRWLPAGHTVGLEVPVKLKKPTRVATLPVGYLNGLGAAPPRRMSLSTAFRRWRGKELPALRVGGQRAKIIGRIGAMETLIDVTGLRCNPGDWVQLELDPMYAKAMPRVYR